MIDISQVIQSPFILGGAAFSGSGGGYGFGSIEKNMIENIVRQALDNGVCSVDLAPIYGFGEAEKSIGNLPTQLKQKLFLTSKSGVSWHSTKRVNMTNCPEVTQKMLEQSLRDLKSSPIDCYFIHWPDSTVDIRRPMEVLSRKKDNGDIRYIGLCNTTLEDFNLASEIDEVSIIQSEYNLFQTGIPTALEKIIIEKKIPVWGWGSLDKGIISGSVTIDRQFDKDDCRSWAPWWKKSNKNEKIKLMAKVLEALPNGKKDVLPLALHHAKNSKMTITPIIGVKSNNQLTEMIDAHKKIDRYTQLYQEIYARFFDDKK